MEFEDFAAKYRLKIKLDECRDPVIEGKLGHIYPHTLNGEVYGLVLLDTHKGTSRSRSLILRRRTALSGGFQGHQEGACESILLFNPLDKQQVRLAIKLARIKRIRRQTGKGKPFLKVVANA